MNVTQLNQEKNMFIPPSQNGRKKRTKKDFSLWIILGVIAVFFVFSLVQLKIDYMRLWTGTGKLFEFIWGMFPPDVSNWKKVLSAGVESIQIALVGTILGIILSLFLAFFAASNLSPHPVLSAVIKGVAAFVRAVPALIWVLIFIVAVGMGPFPGILALAFNSVGMLVKVYAQSIEELDEGIFEGMRATGANWGQIVFQGIIPSVATAIMSWSIFRFEIDFRYATILGMVGAGGIGWELTSAMRMYRLQEAIFIVFVIFFMVFIVEMLGNRLKRTI